MSLDTFRRSGRCDTGGIDGGIDNVNDKELIPKLAKHLANVFTEGREAIQ